MADAVEPREADDDQRRHRRPTQAPVQELGPEDVVTVEDVTNEEDDDFGDWSTVHRGKTTGYRKPSWLGRSKFSADYEDQGGDDTPQAAMKQTTPTIDENAVDEVSTSAPTSTTASCLWVIPSAKISVCQSLVSLLQERLEMQCSRIV
jgi:hypothetical protein